MQRRSVLKAGLAARLCSPLVLLARPARAGQEAPVRRLRFAVTFINPFERDLANQAFWCYLPAELAPRQRLRQVQVSMPHTMHSDALGHRILGLSFARFPGMGQKVVTLTAEVDASPAADTGLAAPPDGGDWLGPERYVESDAEPIRALAALLRRPTASETTRAIYDWVCGNLTYAGYLADDFGALYALRELGGDCTEYAGLVVALARANRIPARVLGGYVMTQDGVPRPQDYHNWAEVFIDGAWRTVDAQKQSWLPPAGAYVAFRISRDALSNPVGQAHRYRTDGEMQVRF
ncbi:transglutaminase domain-containing protein [Massilia sp. CCM 8734]|uniref:transglutaminase-like domain-containing protein n=1 Tax=Massilia sp. CCM 8734 TaxID=2609283 RepID=UPI0014238F4D|nr:transglutaminase domain-containing protein [Massilia sp. CCM 8734]NHZ99835.1 hypothetical protein [Massilia sp. CCM 8734]